SGPALLVGRGARAARRRYALQPHIGAADLPVPLVAAHLIALLALRRVTVDQRAGIERVSHAADLVLDLKQHLAGVDIDDRLPAVLVGIALLGQEFALQQLAVARGEIL